jgi:hypothetical protein
MTAFTIFDSEADSGDGFVSTGNLCFAGLACGWKDALEERDYRHAV